MTSSTLAATGKWTATTATLPAPRGWLGQYDGPVKVTKDGKELVLIVGGSDTNGAAVDEVLLVDPAAAVWTPATEKLSTARRLHTVTVVDSGKKVLVIGGATGAFSPDAPGLATAELYEVSTGKWTAVANNMKDGRWGHTATLLAGDKVLVTGGSTGRSGQGVRTLATAEILDVATGKWTDAPPMLSARTGHGAVEVGGKVLVVGGATSVGPDREVGLAYCELYNGTTWEPTGSLAAGRRLHSVVKLADGGVLAIGGAAPGSPTGATFDPFSQATVERYAGGTWSAAKSLPYGRAAQRAIEVKANQVLTIGGTGGDAGYQNSFLLTSDWAATPAPVEGRWGFGAVALSNDRVLVVGGVLKSGAATAQPGVNVLTKNAEIYSLNAAVAP
ncbi:Kelch repeat-containing protein [Kribbella sp. NPDC056951]|uniref:Kelch repeat-containing protein n=1 Tax=Kribbella sp. NPDC056951 TaxID=3345978 RepID=UPI0036413C8A